MGSLWLFSKLFRISEEVFTVESKRGHAATKAEISPAKTQSAPSSRKQENIFSLRPWHLGAINFPTLRTRRLRGAISESCFAGKPVALFLTRLILVLFFASTAWYDQAQAQSASLRLNWTDTSDNEDGFKIERLVGGLVETTLTAPNNATSYTDSALVAGTVYCYRVEAFNSAGNSDPSNQACAMAEASMASVSPTATKPGGTIAASWNGITAPTTTDWIGLYAPGSADTNFIKWIYVSCSTTPSSARTSGSCPFVLPTSMSLGNFELRLFANDGFTRLATTNSFTVTNTTLTANPTTMKAGATMTASWSGITAPASKDWIGLYAAGAADTKFINWMYVSCSMTPGTARASGSCSYLLPATLVAGNYELRLFANDGFSRLGATNSFTVTTGTSTPPALTVNPNTVKAGGTVTATWSGITAPAPMDWIGLYVPGTTDTSFINWIYVSCSMTPSTARASGSCSYPLPTTIPSGNYELRLLANDGFTRLAAASTFTVTTATSSTPTLTVNPNTVKAGATVTAAWSGITAPTPKDWIGLYAPGATDTSFVNWIYISCSKTAGTARTSGSCSYVLPTTLASGNYELRLFANDGFTRLATSDKFTVSTSTGTSVVLANVTGNGSTTNSEPQVPREWTDYDLKLNFRSMSNNSIGVMFRYQDNRNYYRFVWNQQSRFRRLEKVQNGNTTVLAEDGVRYVDGQTYQAQIIAQGATLRVIVDGGQIFSVVDGTFTEGTVGLYSSSNRSSFDNVVVQDLNTGAALLSQDFNDGTFNGWTIVDQGKNDGPSVWSATTGSLVQTSSIDGTFALYTLRNWRDYRLTLKMQSQDRDSIGVMFRYQDNDNYYRFSWNRRNNFRRLEKRQNGVFTVLSEDVKTYVTGQTYQLEIVATGTTLGVAIDGTSIFSVVDPSLDRGTIALYSNFNQGSSFDDVLVQDLTTGNPLLSVGFTDAAFSGWTIVDEGIEQRPSAWSVKNGSLVQSSNIGSNGTGNLGTYALY